jgi:hypothetical protein
VEYVREQLRRQVVYGAAVHRRDEEVVFQKFALGLQSGGLGR